LTQRGIVANKVPVIVSTIISTLLHTVKAPSAKDPLKGSILLRVHATVQQQLAKGIAIVYFERLSVRLPRDDMDEALLLDSLQQSS
jgi:hypothetical protein